MILVSMFLLEGESEKGPTKIFLFVYSPAPTHKYNYRVNTYTVYATCRVSRDMQAICDSDKGPVTEGVKQRRERQTQTEKKKREMDGYHKVRKGPNKKIARLTSKRVYMCLGACCSYRDRYPAENLLHSTPY